MGVIHKNLFINQNQNPISSLKLINYMNNMDSCYISIQRGYPSYYLKLYFNFCYYALIIPFRFQFNPQSNTYELKTNSIQKIFCLLTFICCMLEEMITLRSMIENIQKIQNGKEDPLYFDIFNSISNFIYYITVSRTIWFKSTKFLILMKSLLENENRQQYYFQNRNNNLKAKLWISLTISSFIIYPTSYILGFFLRRTYSSWYEIINIWGTHSARVFFIEEWIQNTYFIIQIIFAILRLLFLISYTQITTSMEVLLLNSGMLLHDIVQDFGKMVKDTNGICTQQILEEYDEIRNISKKLNKAIGLLTFGLTLACMPYYVVNFLEFMKPENMTVFIRHLLFFTNVFGFLILATLTHKKALVLQDLILTTRNFSEVPIHRLCILLHDMSGGNIGFSGSGFFKITPGFLGTIISLLITFSIIIIQFKTSNVQIPINLVT